MDEWSPFTDNSKEKCVVVCTNERLLKNYFSSRNNDYMIVDLETIHWTTLEPFIAIYWKTLPVGYRVDFVYTDVEDRDKNKIPYHHVERFHMRPLIWYFWK